MTKTKMPKRRFLIYQRVRRGALQRLKACRTRQSPSRALPSQRSSRSWRSTASVDHLPTRRSSSEFKSANMSTAIRTIASAQRDLAKRCAICSRRTSPPSSISASPPVWKRSSTPLQRVAPIGAMCCRSSGAPSIHSFSKRRSQSALESSATVPAKRSAPKDTRWRSDSADSVGISPARCTRNMPSVNHSQR